MPALGVEAYLVSLWWSGSAQKEFLISSTRESLNELVLRGYLRTYHIGDYVDIRVNDVIEVW